MKLLILDECYPHPGNLMAAFVHVRAKEYARKHQVQVFSYFHKPQQLEYEGIPIEMFDDAEKLVQAIKNFGADKILIHFYQSWMLEKLIKKIDVPVIIWVHGYEALGWYRRLFNFSMFSPVLINYIIKNTKQQYHFRKLISYANKFSNVELVFVSNWMKRIAEIDTLSTIKRYSIIPNPIDVNLFAYEEKDPALRTKVLILRSFTTRKYANDISVKAIQKLAATKDFNDFEFTIIGDGELFDSTLAPIRDFKNVTIKRGAVRQIHIPPLHQAHGIFLCPTRQDAQGVSMCEAMSSGLVAVTSHSTAIPEFVTHMETGWLTSSADEIASALLELKNNPALFKKISANAARSMRQLCSIEQITKMELALIEESNISKQFNQVAEKVY